MNELDALLTRAESAPVGASYRALAESPQLTTNPRIRALLDSLNGVDRDREAIGTADPTDPAFVALSARATEIGRAIQASARDRRDALREQIAKLSTPVPQEAVATSPGTDTAAWIAARDSAGSLLTQATLALTDAREKVQTRNLEAVRASENERVDVPPSALLGAALVFGIALGFGSAIAREVRHPRISSDHEVERVTGARVLATVRLRRREPDRTRRNADQEAPPYFDPAADGYQLAYLHVARAGASRLMLAVVAEETGIAAVVATNIAAIAADEARSTLLIDTDWRSCPVAAVLVVHAEPGLADVMERGIDWSEVTTQATVGRDRVIDVISSGVSSRPSNPAEIAELLRQESPKFARHYEAIIAVVSADFAGISAALPIPDTIVCARIGHTRIADLQRWLSEIRTSGGNSLGVVLWDGRSPSLPSSDRLARSHRPLKTTEMRALTSSR